MSRLPIHAVDVANPDRRPAAIQRDFDTRVTALERASTFGPGQEIDFQKINGSSESYSITISSTTYAPLDPGTGSQNMMIQYTPPVPVWWDVTLHVGVVQKLDAAYHYSYMGAQLNIPDADGAQNALAICTQHSGVNQFEARHVQRRFKLNAGTTYQVYGAFSSVGGSWNYYRGKDQLWLEAKAITR